MYIHGFPELGLPPQLWVPRPISGFRASVRDVTASPGSVRNAQWFWPIKMGDVTMSPYQSWRVPQKRWMVNIWLMMGNDDGSWWLMGFWMGFHSHGDTPKMDGWFLLGKMPNKMDDDWGYPYDETETSYVEMFNRWICHGSYHLVNHSYGKYWPFVDDFGF